MKEMFRSPEMSLLRQSVRLDDFTVAVSQAEEIIRNNLIDWDDVYARSDFHSIKPQVWYLLKKLPQGVVPAQVLVRFEEAYKENLLQQLRNAGEFFSVTDALSARGITAVPFKGFWLAHDVYGDLGDRESSDVDLFVNAKDVERIKPVMKELGFVVQDTLTKLREEYVFKELAEYNFNRWAEDGARLSHIEFHWRMGLRPYRMNIRMEDLSSQVITCTLQNRKFRALTPEANLILAVMHHGGKDRFVRLKNILDIARLVSKYKDLNWDWILGTAQRFRVEKLVFLGVYIASVITGVRVPPLISDKVSAACIRMLGNNRIKRMAIPVSEWYTFSDELRGWFFKIRSRDGLLIKMQLGYYTLRKILMPTMVPFRWRHYFFNKKILAPDDK
ncbi:MAG TPA: nucleotidyltransferase family protein [Bacteroidales bacterium]|nr:nucleotidyltransferase family protein [Bacteroidales bacterium]HPR13668.1 nucleotidyltransferase family protein [Bacteroidales bacterium]